MTANEPRHVYRRHEPQMGRDWSIPDAETHDAHVSDVMHESRNKGFPVACKDQPLPRAWP